MATVKQLIARLESLQGKEIDYASAAIQENEKTAADLVASQLAQGIKSDGSAAVFSYAPFTIALKKRKAGLAGITDHLTNFDTGESYQKLYLKVEGDKIEFGTKTDKEASISDRMDGKAFGLNQDNKEEFIRQHVQPFFVKKIKEFLQL